MAQISAKLDAALLNMQRLLALEIEECRDRAKSEREGVSDKVLESRGLLLKGAALISEEPALFGRSRCTFVAHKDRPRQLNAFGVRSGTQVQVRNADGELGPVGVVVFKNHRFLKIVFDETLDDVNADAVNLWRLEDEISLQRMGESLRKVKANSEKETLDLFEVLLGVRDAEPSFAESSSVEADDDVLVENGNQKYFLDEELNAEQKIAVQKAVGVQKVALIHGPPGTGKTRTVVEVVRQFLKKGERVLCLCSSNAAVDHVAIGLLEKDAGLSLARAGHPARVNVLLEKHTLAALTDEHALRKLSKKLVEDAFSLLRGARKRSDRSGDAFAKKREAKREAGQLFADARRLERQAVAEVLRKTKILCGTLTGFQHELPDDESYDVLVVDEASQVLTPSLFSALLRVKKVVLAGDHRQLGPVVMSQKAAQAGLSQTCFEMLMSKDEAGHYSQMLKVQHRMHETLMAFSSAEFYDGQLIAHESVAQHSLSDFSVDSVDFPTDKILDFIDTAGAGFLEDQAHDSASKHNDDEAEWVVRSVRALMDAGLDCKKIGVLSPYSAQTAVLQSALAEEIQQGLEVDSVDGFQGREKETMVMSCVRSNDRGEIGFLGDERRLNVAFTRARRKLVVVGDSATLGNHALWGRWVDYAIASSSYRSCFELMSL